MLDLKFIRENPEQVKTGLARKGVESTQIQTLLDLDGERRGLLQEVEALKASRNKANDSITKAKQDKADAGPLIAAVKTSSQKIHDLDDKVGRLSEAIEDILYSIPNIPHSDVPDGDPPEGNQVIRHWGKLPEFKFKPKDHVALAKESGWIGFSRAAKVTGSGFALFEGDGARLVRGLINFMLDVHTKEHGYKEVWPPALVNRASMTGTGQLPKLEEDMYRLKDEDYFLIPTAEVPISNMHREEVLDEGDLPIRYTAYTPCFRREAGSYGKDTKGLSRVHQFDKVELVRFVKSGTSLEELESLVKHAEKILQLLELPYRVTLLCAKDMSFAAGKCYDLEVYAPGSKRWLEVSSCSAFFDFQARRMNVRVKPKGGGKKQYVETLNGSGVALARTIICLLENHQQPDGSIRVPDVLKPYF